MAAKAGTPQSAEIGVYGFVPDFKTGEIETTVFTMGGKTWAGSIIALVHLITWITAICMISLWGNTELGKITDATDAAKMLGNVYAAFIAGILVMVLVHAALARKEEPFGSTLASVMLLAMIAFENSMGCAYVAYALQLGNSNFYSAAMVSQLFVCLGSAMIVAFYVNWSHRGNVKPLLPS